MRKTLTLFICILFTLLASGCARRPGTSSVDPYERFNRFTFAFNQCIDHLALRPIAKVYDTITPPPLREGVTNIYNNVDELQTMANDILQGKIRYAFVDFWRLVINSTIGIGGLFDVASRMGLPKHYEDFGMTLAYWSGGTKSPYLVLPIIGPSTFRAGLGMLADISTKPTVYITPRWIRYASFGLYAINTRARLLAADKLIDTAFDPYVFVRNAYLQKRNQLIAKNQKSLKTVIEEQRHKMAEEQKHDSAKNKTKDKTKAKIKNSKAHPKLAVTQEELHPDD